MSRRASVSPELLRAWEHRYGLLQPARSSGGFRLYSLEDLERVRLMKQYLAAGLAAADAARLALSAPVRPAGTPIAIGPAPEDLDAERLTLTRALRAFDDFAAQVILDHLFASFDVDVVLRDVILREMQDLGQRWARGETTVAQEHFTSNLFHARIMGVAHGWDAGEGLRAILACPPDEYHDLPLAMFGVALRRQGWRITYFGTATPIGTLANAAQILRPALVVLSAAITAHLRDALPGIAELARTVPVAIAGGGASEELALAAGARLLRDDPITAAQQVAVSAADA